MNLLGESYRGRTVMVTGHTGFKGSWLCEWLLELGAKVTGLSLPPPTTPNHFDLLELEKRMRHRICDVRNRQGVEDVLAEAKPEIVFHLAAQSLVRPSYADPSGTWSTNVTGTLNLLESMRRVSGTTACVVVTTDKCYENHETGEAFREDAPLGGHDPYSASKAAVEILVSSYRRSFPVPMLPLLATARAGNVVGGGDWAPERLATDIIKAVSTGDTVRLRMPNAIRPWQHVLEPLYGYLTLGASLMGKDGAAYAKAWNFGPSNAASATALQFAEGLERRFGRKILDPVGSDDNQPHEANTLRLDCSQAARFLGWKSTWDLERTIDQLADWHRSLSLGQDARSLARRQIGEYVADVRVSGSAQTGGR